MNAVCHSNAFIVNPEAEFMQHGNIVAEKKQSFAERFVHKV